MSPLTARLRRHVELAFPPASVARVVATLQAWRIPYEDSPPGERLVGAVVLLADGDPDRLSTGLEIAARDWRDLLVAAGLENADWSHALDRRLLG